MEILKIIVGVAAVFVAWLFLFRTGAVFKLNAWMRENVFNDQIVLFSGRRLAILLLVLGGVALFSGIEGIQEEQSIPPKIISRMLEQARDSLIASDYPEVIIRCREVLRSDPNNLIALELTATAWWGLNEKEKARETIREIVKINPNHPLNRGPIARYFEKQRKGF